MKEEILNQERKIKNILRKFTFVRWDRFTETTGELNFYGWIERKQDKYKDFLALTIFLNDFSTWFLTSSAKYDRKINEILKLNKKGAKCKRVEHYFELPNAIKLTSYGKQIH